MLLQKKIKKVVIANRGEIARRIQETCHTLDIETVAIYTEEDAFSPYVFSASESYKLSKNGATGYLDFSAIIDIAKKSNADAIHPGYGFLSENGFFAQAVIDAGLSWIGPSPKSILLLGDKAKAQIVMKQEGIPVVPGKVFCAKQSDNYILLQSAKIFAKQINFPVLIKCAHGGGGKAMRLVTEEKDFEQAWKSVLSESQKFFKSQTIIVEKQIVRPRHVEVQIAGDGSNYIHLYERECSLQRRNQKIIEESPCNFIDQTTKQKLYATAIKVAKAVEYKNIGTVEFLVDEDQNFYFLEMNTRLQVEHSVTEFVTGIDLIALQIKITEEEVLPYQQKEIFLHGHAIECRIYAEDPKQNFAPSTGTIKNFILPKNPFVRIDNDLEEGCKITPFFDPMLFKMTSHRISRMDTIKNMIAAIKSTHIFGIETNLLFLKNILMSNFFQTGNIDTQFLENNRSIITSLSSESPEKKHHFTVSKKNEIAKTIKESIEKKISSTKEFFEKKQTRTNNWKNQKWK